MNHATPWIVMKFGGTSVGDPDNWPAILENILDCREAGERPFVVCSALSGVSNLLQEMLDSADAGKPIDDDVDRFRRRHLAFADALDVDADGLVAGFCDKLVDRLHLDRVRHSPRVPPQIRAQVMSVGELLSTQITAEWLRAQGLSVAWKDARAMLTAKPACDGASEDQQYLSATCRYDLDDALVDELNSDDESIVLTQGFIASNPADGRTVLLGRGGSDTAAAYLAAKIGARRLEIWTDVPGVYTANPQQVPGARLLYELSYDESETLAGLGAKVLHAPCIQPVRHAGIPLYIRWTADADARGTVVSALPDERPHGVKAVSARTNLVLISMERRTGWQPVGFMADVAACFKRHALSMDMLSSSPSLIQTTLDLSAGSGVAEKIPALVDDLQKVCNPTVEDDVASVSLVGHEIQACLHHLGPTLERVRERELLMVSHAANNSTFSFVVPRDEAADLVCSLHEELFEETELDECFGPSWHALASNPADKASLVGAATGG